MKSFTKLLVAAVALLLPLSAYAFTVSSTSTPVSNIQEGYYVLHSLCKGTEGTVYSSEKSASGSTLIHTSSVSYQNVSDTKYIWYVTRTENGLIIENVGTGAYIPRQSSHGGNMSVAKDVANAAILAWDDTNISANQLENGVTLYQVQYKIDGKNNYIHTNGNAATGTLNYWEGGVYTGSSSSVLQFAFHEVTGDDLTAMTEISYAVAVKNADGSTTYSVETKNQNIESGSNNISVGLASSEYSYWYTATTPTTLTVNETDKTVSRTNATFTSSRVYYTEGTAPFTYYTNDNPALYTIKFRSKDTQYLIHTDGVASIATNASFTSSNMTDFTKLKGALWGFVKDGYGVKLLCYQNKQYATLTKNGADKDTLTLSDNGSTFIGLTNSNGGFTLKVKGVDHSVIGDHSNNQLGVWNSTADIQNDGGSNFGITSADDASVLTIAKNIFKTQADAEDYSSYGNMVIARTNWSTNNATAQAATKCVDIIKLAEESAQKTFSFDPTAYYTINCCNTQGAYKYLSSENISMTANGSAVASDGTSKKLYHVSNATAIPHRLFQIPADGQIKSVNTGFFLNGADGLVSTAPTDKFTFSIVDVTFSSDGTNDKTSMFRLQYGSSSKYINAYKGTSNNCEIGEWDGDNDPSNFWQFTKVTEIPVTISTIGYASVCLPVPVTLSQDGITAYIVTGNNGSTLTLEEIASGTVIPAGTGFLVASGSTEEKTATFTIASEAGTALTNNLMEGVNARRTGLTAQENYVLTKGSDGKAVFRIYDPTAMPANKAYLKISKMTNSEGIMAFNFDNQVTGINAATTTPAAETYFDLNGRRVLYPAYGIYVKSNGQKVFIK